MSRQFPILKRPDPAALAARRMVAPFVYVANAGDDTISKIDTGTDKVIATMRSEPEPSALTVTPDSELLFSVSARHNTVSAYLVAADTLEGTVPVGRNPQGVLIVITPNGPRSYVVNAGSDDIWVLDESAERVAIVPAERHPLAIAATPDGRHALVVNEHSDSVTVIDTASNTVSGHVRVGDKPVAVAISADGGRAYVVNHGCDDIAVLETVHYHVVGRIRTANGPRSIALHPHKPVAYVAHGSHFVDVIDLSSGARPTEIRVGDKPESVVLTPSGDHLYVANRHDGTVSAIDTRAYKVTATIKVGKDPTYLAVTP